MAHNKNQISVLMADDRCMTRVRVRCTSKDLDVMDINREEVNTSVPLESALRAFVAEKLIESLDVPDAPLPSAKWKKEVRRRCAEMDRGAVKLRAASAVFAKAYAALA